MTRILALQQLAVENNSRIPTCISFNLSVFGVDTGTIDQ